MAYVTGANSLKIGYQGTVMTDYRTWSTNSQNLSFRVNNLVPNQITELVGPWQNNGDGGWHALFAQDQWTPQSLHPPGGAALRSVDQLVSRTDRRAVDVPPDRDSYPARPTASTATRTSRRAWACRGTSSATARRRSRSNIGKYLEGAGVSNNWANANPTLRAPGSGGPFAPLSVTRSWTDANRNFVPDCNLANPGAQSPATTGSIDSCGAISNQSFALLSQGQFPLTNSFDPALLNGWGVRASDWTLGASVQQQLMARASVEVAYTRRWYHGFTVLDNQVLSNSDLTPYSITVPSDPRLPGGGGYTVGTLYDVNPAKFGQVNNLVTDSQQYGDWYQYFNGVDVTLNFRMKNGLTFQGGTSTGKQIADNCAVRANLPELSANLTPGLPGLDELRRQHAEPVLPCGLRHPDAGARPRVVHHPEDRAAGERRVPEQAGCAARSELLGSELGHHGGARAHAGRQPRQRDDQRPHAWRDVRRSDQPARLPDCEDPAVRPHSNDARRRYLQLAQLERHPDV